MRARDRPEPDALSRWYGMQRRLWWKRWRWAAWIFIALALLRSLGIAAVYVAYYWRELADSTGQQLPVWLLQTATPLWRLNRELGEYLQEGAVVVAIAVSTFEARSATLPSIVAVTASPIRAYRFQITAFRIIVWRWTACLVTLPLLLHIVGIVVLSSFPQATYTLSYIPYLVLPLPLSVLVAETQVFVLFRQAQTLAWMYWTAVPILVYFGWIELKVASESAIYRLLVWNGYGENATIISLAAFYSCIYMWLPLTCLLAAALWTRNERMPKWFTRER